MSEITSIELKKIKSEFKHYSWPSTCTDSENCTEYRITVKCEGLVDLQEQNEAVVEWLNKHHDRLVPEGDGERIWEQYGLWRENKMWYNDEGKNWTLLHRSGYAGG